MDNAAYGGLAGEVVSKFKPHTEADPVSILIHLLIFFGNVIGKNPYYQVEADRHHTNLFGVVVGASAKARKGTSAERVRSVMKAADERWIEERTQGGLSSGEGLISVVRDKLTKWNSKTSDYEVIDPGVTDKRFVVTEAEFGSALAVMARPGNTLSPTIRNVWDGKTLSTLTKNSPLKATSHHISIIAHITEEELRRGIDRTDAANGFANRFLFALVRRSNVLPFGGNLDETEIVTLAERIKTAVEFAKKVGRVEMTEKTRELWKAVYPELSKAQPGLLGAITARAEAQTIRLALIYALLDGKDQIDIAHLEAALAVWEYCEASAAHIFGKLLGDPLADEILLALRNAGGDGMTRTALRDLLARHQSGQRIGAALALLESKNLARVEPASTGGRPSETWFVVEAAYKWASIWTSLNGLARSAGGAT
jgi:hypothetical protein